MALPMWRGNLVIIESEPRVREFKSGTLLHAFEAGAEWMRLNHDRMRSDPPGSWGGGGWEKKIEAAFALYLNEIRPPIKKLGKKKPKRRRR